MRGGIEISSRQKLTQYLDERGFGKLFGNECRIPADRLAAMLVMIDVAGQHCHANAPMFHPEVTNRDFPGHSEEVEIDNDEHNLGLVAQLRQKGVETIRFHRMDEPQLGLRQASYIRPCKRISVGDQGTSKRNHACSFDHRRVREMTARQPGEWNRYPRG